MTAPADGLSVPGTGIKAMEPFGTGSPSRVTVPETDCRWPPAQPLTNSAAATRMKDEGGRRKRTRPFLVFSSFILHPSRRSDLVAVGDPGEILECREAD